VCGAQFNAAKNINQYERQVHSGEHQTCQKCGKRYTRKAKLLEHLKKCAVLVCPTCGDEFDQLLHLNRHKVTQHPETVPRSMAGSARVWQCRRMEDQPRNAAVLYLPSSMWTPFSPAQT
jgi:NAD-dependent SIR2 family protein deacetylase